MNIQKYSGAGNKFIVIDNLNKNIKKYTKIVLDLSSAYTEIDGVIFLEQSSVADFKMNYFNKDGTGDALCGNGLRCIVKYINDNNVSKKNELNIEAVSNIYACKVIDEYMISVLFPPPKKIKTNFKLKVHFQEWWELLNCSYVDCGSPHVVVFINEIEKPKVKELNEIKINEWGRNIRMHKDLMPDGANVNFVKIISEERKELEIRSYERGVEGETLACGTGAISAALIFYILYNHEQPVSVLTKSGEFLFVDFDISDKKLNGITLTGGANKYE